MKKLPIDSLMLIFYYREGTFAQTRAADELKRQNWRFHKKFGVWFKRTEGGVRTMNPAFEFGAFNFLDSSSDRWGLRTRSDFTFEYEYLEEEPVSIDSGSNPELAVDRRQQVGQ